MNNHENAPTGTETVATAIATSSPNTDPSASPTIEQTPTTNTPEAKYSADLAALSAEQKVVRGSLEPDSLANMSDAQLKEAFTIHLTEVAGSDGKVDPKKLAEAVAAREQALRNIGCSSDIMKKYGGPTQIGNAETQAILQSVPMVGKVLYGDGGANPDATTNSMHRCTLSLEADPTSVYFNAETVVADSVTYTANSDGSLKDVTFKVHEYDNLPKEKIEQIIGSATIPRVDQEVKIVIDNIQVSPDNTLTPIYVSYS